MKPLKAVGIHVFAGLFTAGVKSAGFDIVEMLEDGKFGQATHKLNFPEIPISDDVASWPVELLRSANIDLVFSNSPCAGLSVANSSRGADNPINQALEHSCATALRIQPQIYVVESVSALFTDGAPMVERWERAWQTAGYNTCRLLESAEHLGLPQVRKRAIFIAARSGIQLARPLADAPPVTVRQAIEDLSTAPLDWAPQPYTTHATHAYARKARLDSLQLTHHLHGNVSKAIASIVPHLGQGQRADSLSEEVIDATYRRNRLHPVKPDGRPSLLFRRLAWDKPSVVITGGAHWFHPEHNRLLTVREQARLMGVPDWFRFSGNIAASYAELGKAVSPIVGGWLANQLACLLRAPLSSSSHQAEISL